MTIDFTQKVFPDTYKDDFKDSDNYYRVLFNSGRALQARELTQMQTIIQKEMERFGSNVFKEGAAVQPGNVTVNAAYEFVKLNTAVNAFPTNFTSLVGNEFSDGNVPAKIKAKVLEAIPATATEPATLYLRYTKTSGASSGTTPIKFSPGTDISDGSTTLTIQTTNTVANPAAGLGCRASVESGSFFVQGHFVSFNRQSIILDKYNKNPTATIGFKVVQDIVRAADAEALYDNQGALPNKAAPGADRYRIRLELINQTEITEGQNFVFVANITKGKVTEGVTGFNSYAKIADALAQRTAEINGDFTAKQFRVKIDENDSDATKIDLDISPGVSYVNGYRASSNIPRVITIPKAQTSQLANNEVVAASYGNYVLLADSTNTPSIRRSLKTLPNMSAFQVRNLKDSVNHLGTTIGTARTRYIQEDGAQFKYYLFDVKMNSGKSFRNVKSIGGSTNDYANVGQIRGQTPIYEGQNNNLLFPLPTSRPKLVTDISLEVQRYLTGTFDFSGNASLTLTATGETFANPSQWITTVDSNGRDVSASISTSGIGSQAVTVSNGPTSSTFEALVKVNKSAGTVRSKTLNVPNAVPSTSTNGTFITSTLDSEGAGTGAIKVLNLAKSDLFELVSVKDGDSTGIDIKSRFIVDNGQRDNFYAPARLILKKGATVPASNVFATFKYFTHGASGDFFAVNSYSGQVEYGKIPNHTLADGTKVNLRDVLDFRPRLTDDGANYAGGTARLNELPSPNDLINLDAEYYLPRHDRLTIDVDGKLKVIQGQPSLSPKFPEVPINSLEIYRVKLNPFTINDSDADLDLIETKVFTMRDIGKLETRIDQIEEIATLSALETNLKTFEVFDSLGLDRTKAGFLVDNFRDQLSSNTASEEYAASIDPREGLLRPSFNEDQIGLFYDSSISSNVIKKGDNVYLKYTEVNWIDQPIFSGTINVNPFAVITNTGRITLSPQSDDWREVKRVPPRMIDGGFRLDPRQQNLWNNWEWQWGGTDVNNLAGRTLGSSSSSGSSQSGNRVVTTNTTSVTRIVQGETIREVVADRVLDVAVIPFMRSRKVYFKAEGLKPSTQVFAYFNNVSVSEWVRPETFKRASDDPAAYGSRYNASIVHPEGKGTLTTDDAGKLEGSFFIPNTSNIKFRTGQREFKLLDITLPNDDDASTRGFSMYEANGILETKQETIRSTRLLNVRTSTSRSQIVRFIPQDDGGGDGGGPGGDPIAQSFEVYERDGIFVSKVGVRFATKDEGTVPVQMELRTMVNGSPSSYDVIPGATVFKDPGDVNTSEDGSVVTYFEFEEPIYLQGYKEYCFVMLAETIGYNVFIAETGEFLFGSTEKRITKQPTLGSFFKSQNSFTWTPAQNIDMAFELVRCDFSTAGGTTIVETGDPGFQLLEGDPITTVSGTNKARVFYPDHGFTTGDVVQFAGLDSATRYAGILGKSINGLKTVDSYDNDFISVDFDSNANASETFGEYVVAASSQMLFEQVVPVVQTMSPTSTTITMDGAFTSGKSIAGIETDYSKSNVFLPLIMSENNYFNVPQIIPSREQRVSNLSGGKAGTLRFNMSTNNSYVSPVIDMQRASFWTIHNRIDFQSDNGDSNNRNNPLIYVPETDPNSGTTLAKHITRSVTLEADAVGLKIILAANRPSVTDFKFWYKAIPEDVLFDDTPWTEVVRQSNLPTDENPAIYRDYEYLVGGDDGLTEPFSKFILKITMNSSNNSYVPQFKDLRVIALSV